MARSKFRRSHVWHEYVILDDDVARELDSLFQSLNRDAEARARNWKGWHDGLGHIFTSIPHRTLAGFARRMIAQSLPRDYMTAICEQYPCREFAWDRVDGQLLCKEHARAARRYGDTEVAR